MEAAQAARNADVGRSKSASKSNEKAHWVKPELVAQVKFTEWTTDGKLRHPVYLGLRDDKKATDVRREEPRVTREAPMKTPMKTSKRGKVPAQRRSTPATSSSSSAALEKSRRDGKLDLAGRRRADGHEPRTRSSGRS